VLLIDTQRSTIILKASTQRTFAQCLQQFVTPLSRLPHALFTSVPARLVFSVYLGTFLTANTIDTVTNLARGTSPAHVNANTAKFVGTAVMSTSLTVYKDSRMARCLGSSIRAATPLSTYSLFTLRDAVTIFVAFNLPVLVAPKLEQLPPEVKERFGSILNSESGRFKAAQFLLPVAAQIVTTPIHLLGLDLYNRQKHVSPLSRLTRVLKDMRVAIPARMVRVVPAFGTGGVINAGTRRSLMTSLEE
jgi:hypothetical protein